MISKYDHLKAQALKLRQDTFKAFVEHGEAHLGGSFSMIEILIAVYEEFLQPNDKFILSKAHASFPLCILLKDKGFSPKLKTHLERDESNGIFATTGSLGHGLPIGVGMAIARKRKHQSGRIVVLISDGECQEGTTWESLLIASKHQLDNLLIIVDYNKIQALNRLDDALPLEDLGAKFHAFNWECHEVHNGHSFDELILALHVPVLENKPHALLVHTVKGKGIQSFENDPAWHARKIKSEELLIGNKALGLI